MKTRNYFNIFAVVTAVTMVLGSCTKEIENPEEPKDDAQVVTVVTAGIADADTKTYMGDAYTVGEGDDAKTMRKVYWEDGDQISINGTESAALAGVDENASTVEFGFEGSLTKPYQAVYPAGIWKSATLVTLPAEYAYPNHASKKSFAQNALPMAAYAAEGGNLTFRHLCAVLKLSLTGDKTIDYVEFSGRNNEKVSGDMYLDCTETMAELLYAGVGDEEKLLKVTVGKDLSSEPTEIFIAVPVTYHNTEAGATTKGLYSKGFTVKVYDTEGDYMELTKDDACTFVAGHVYNMPSVEYTSVPIGITISSAEELIAFATNNKNYDSVVNLTSDIVFDETSSADFAATGGITNFGGVFNGNGKRIKNYTALKPIFASNTAAGIISDLTIDESCVFNVVCNNAQMAFAPLVENNSGTIKNCHSNAVINISGNNTQGTYVGGMVRRVTGINTFLLDGCSFGGQINGSADFNATSIVMIGGLVAYFSSDAALIKNSTFKGHINFEGKVGDSKELYIGGIASKTGCTIENCSVDSDAENYRIKVSNNDAQIRYLYMGGICGYFTGKISGCDNYGNLLVDTHGNGNYCWLGGIAGYNKGNMTDSSNNGEIKGDIYRARLIMGGVAGQNNSGTISNCTNAGAIVSTDGLTNSSIGGIFGENNSTGIKHIANTGELRVSYTNTYDGGTINIGGLIGSNTATINSNEETKENSGAINILAPNTVKTQILYIGGVIGNDGGKTVAPVSNTGTISVPEEVGSNWHVGNLVGGPTAKN